MNTSQARAESLVDPGTLGLDILSVRVGLFEIWAQSVGVTLRGGMVPNAAGIERNQPFMSPAKRSQLVKALMDAMFPQVQATLRFNPVKC